MNRFLLLLWLSAGLVLSGCIDRYTPDVPPSEQINLVVDGFINPLDRSVIKLSRTFSVNTKSTPPTETRAQVVIQDDAGRRYPFTESPAGTYTSATSTLDPGRQYQLRIVTAQGREYASDLTAAIITPPIGALTWQLTDVQGIQIKLSTQGASTAPRYYRWSLEETYQFNAAYQSALEYEASTNTLVARLPDHQIFNCWRTDPSTAILQSNTEQLSQNALVDFPLLTVLPSQKLKIGYSLLVRQVTQPQAEYDYWERLRKNTEALGTVNDPLPGRVTGNVHALADAAEVVLGYVGVHSVAEKRLFISGSVFPTPRPESVFYNPFYATCAPPDAGFSPAQIQQIRDGFLVAITREPALVSTVSCVDCRLHGTNIKPSFWP